MQRTSICHSSNIFRKTLQFLSVDIFRCHAIRLIGFFCQRPWRAVGLLVLFKGHLLLWSRKNVCWPSFAHPHRRITDQGSCWLPPSPPSLLSKCIHLPLPDFFFPTTPPPGLRLSTCGPLPHPNLFTPPPFGRMPNALTQSQIFAWEGVPFSPCFADLFARRYTCICVWNWRHTLKSRNEKSDKEWNFWAEQQISLWTCGDSTLAAVASNLWRLFLHSSTLLPASHLHLLLPYFNSLFVVTQAVCAIHSDVILLVKGDLNGLAPAL